jgi:hypothetical protein
MKDRIIDRLIGFEKILGITAIVIALVAAFFSVYGIATLFAGAFTLTAIMASALEVGKLVAVTFLYRYWKKTQGFLKAYLSIATFVLMIVTSIGIFGYLSAAYQKSALEFKANQEKIVMVESQRSYLTDKIDQSKIRIQTLNEMRKIQEARLSEALTNAFLTRNPIQLKQIQDQTVELVKSADSDIKSEQIKIQESNDEIQKIDQQINEMRFSSASKKDIQTFQFVADQFGSTLDKVAKWFIITLIFVFDPLAVALILAYNVIAYKEEKDKGILDPAKISGLGNIQVSKPFNSNPKPASVPQILTSVENIKTPSVIIENPEVNTKTI